MSFFLNFMNVNYRYSVLGKTCFHLGLLENASAILQMGKSLAIAPFSCKGSSWLTIVSLNLTYCSPTTPFQGHHQLHHLEALKPMWNFNPLFCYYKCGILSFQGVTFQFHVSIWGLRDSVIACSPEMMSSKNNMLYSRQRSSDQDPLLQPKEPLARLLPFQKRTFSWSSRPKWKPFFPKM